jgi:hypothetical protein
MNFELNDAELGLVSGGDIRKEQVIKCYKEPKVLMNDGLNIQTSSPFTSNVGFDSPFTPIPA